MQAGLIVYLFIMQVITIVEKYENKQFPFGVF